MIIVIPTVKQVIYHEWTQSNLFVYSTISFKASDPLSHSCSYLGAWWEVDLGLGVAVSRVVIYNRNDEGSERLSNSVISLINYQGKTLKTYRIGDATDVPVFDINFASYLGCYANSPNRILPHFASGNLDPNGAIECATLCKAAGFNLAGTQISKECWCGDSLNGAQPVPNNNECNMQCLGNAAEMCGGPARNSVYTVASTLTWHLAPAGQTTCDYGVLATRSECASAVAALASAANRTPARGMVIGSGGTCNDGSWGQVPLGCSAQTGSDWAAHYKTSGVNCPHHHYQLVCSPRVLVTKASVHKVRVQLEGTNYLHLREVQVFDQNGVNRALNKLATQSSPFFWGEISSGWNSKCLDYDGNNQVFMWDCHGGSNQQWYPSSNSKVDMRIQADGNRCLDAPGGAFYRVYLHSCHDGNNQKWTYDDIGRLHSVAYPHLCLDLFNHNNNNGAGLVLYQCNNNMNQKWLASTTWADPASKAVNGNLNDNSHTLVDAGMYHELTYSYLNVTPSCHSKRLTPSLTLVLY